MALRQLSVKTNLIGLNTSTYRLFLANSKNPVFFLRTPRIKFFSLALPRGKTRRFATLARSFARVSYLLAEISRSFVLAHFGWILVFISISMFRVIPMELFYFYFYLLADTDPLLPISFHPWKLLISCFITTPVSW